MSASTAPPVPTLDEVLTDRELETVIMAFADGRAPGSFSEAEAAQVFEWAARARIDGALLADVLNGGATIDIGADGELIFAARRRRPA